MSVQEVNNDIDNHVDQTIYDCFNPLAPKSFFLFAGAGSGKTRSLVNVLTRFKGEHGKDFRLKRKKVGIITYTNAACDEIMHRLEYDPIFAVKTIHSFSWELIQYYTADIKEWLLTNLRKEIGDLQDQQSRSRNLNNKTSIERANKIQSKIRRLDNLDNIVAFKYNPNGDNITKDSLNHTEVISITAYLITAKPLLREIIISQYPILLIDESQDTNKNLIDALFLLQADKKDKFSLGLFGDTMQRIYFDGKEKLGQDLPEDWIKPAKKMNHRSSKRVITLINTIRKNDDGQEQIPRTEKPEGFVRFFLAGRNADKDETERRANGEMARITGDASWDNDGEGHDVKTLILEHHMAARRMKFATLFEPLYKEDKLATAFLDGTLPGLTFFTKIILPLIDAHLSDDEFAKAQIVKNHSVFLERQELIKIEDQTDNIRKSRKALDALVKLWEGNIDPKLMDILGNIYKTGLFRIPQQFADLIKGQTEAGTHETNVTDSSGGDEEEDTDAVSVAWEFALNARFSEIRNYNTYMSEDSKFGTHQGVKGLEFTRVAVILDDEEARGFSFSYDKLFGTKELTRTDMDNISEGKETGVDKTRRLFYVACSRAKESLAIVGYTDNPEIVKATLVKNKWFSPLEIIDLG